MRRKIVLTSETFTGGKCTENITMKNLGHMDWVRSGAWLRNDGMCTRDAAWCELFLAITMISLFLIFTPIFENGMEKRRNFLAVGVSLRIKSDWIRLFWVTMDEVLCIWWLEGNNRFDVKLELTLFMIFFTSFFCCCWINGLESLQMEDQNLGISAQNAYFSFLSVVYDALYIWFMYIHM